MTDAEREATNLVHGFFIGGLKDDLQQPNLTKEDLIYSIKEAIQRAEQKGREEILNQLDERDVKIISDEDYKRGLLRGAEIAKTLPMSRTPSSKDWDWGKDYAQIAIAEAIRKEANEKEN